MASSMARLLTNDQAMDRLSIVSLIQILGIAITLGLLGISHLFVTGGGWRIFCWWVGIVAGFGTVAFLLIAHSTIRRRGPNWSERLIQIVFVANTLALALGMARTGGASNSVFSQTIPIQLSGMLLLELQKERLTSSKTQAYWWYAGITISFWIAAEAIGGSCFGTFASNSVDYDIWRRFATAVLFVAGTIFTVITYKFPKFIVDFLKRNIINADQQTPSQKA